MQRALTCAIVLATVSIVAAQQVPQPVIRVGPWVEVGHEVFMHLIATTDIRYRTTHNYDFESRVQDRASSRDNLEVRLHDQEGDFLFEETRLGVDMRYQKNLTMQVLFEHQSTMDGNLIDNRREVVGTGTTAATGGGFLGAESNTVNLERFWLQYAFPGTPLRLLVGADVWFSDQAGLLADDDPRFAVYLDLGPKQEWELGAWATVQSEASQIGLTNDNDFIYYVFHAAYKGLPGHRLGLDVAYFRERFAGAPQLQAGAARPGGFLGQKHDSVLIMPSWSGAIGPLRGLLQFNMVAGTADTTNSITDPASAVFCARFLPTGTGCANRKLDIFAWAVVAYAEVKLGLVTPFAGVVYASGDDDPTDTNLQGFMTQPQPDLALMPVGLMAHFDRAIAFGSRDLAPPARSLNPVLGVTEYGHTVGHPFNDRIGLLAHPGIVTTYSNPGLVLPFVGVKVFPAQGHQIDTVYFYRAMATSEIVSLAFGRDIGKAMYHELMAAWTWTLNPHFDIRFTGNLVIPAAGSKDIAGTVTCPDGTPCEGKDPALSGEARFRARF